MRAATCLLCVLVAAVPLQAYGEPWCPALVGAYLKRFADAPMEAQDANVPTPSPYVIRATAAFGALKAGFGFVAYHTVTVI